MHFYFKDLDSDSDIEMSGVFIHLTSYSLSAWHFKNGLVALYLGENNESYHG